MIYTRGDIILANLPFTDLSGSKVWPARASLAGFPIRFCSMLTNA